VKGRKYHITSFLALVGAPNDPFAPNNPFVPSQPSDQALNAPSAALPRLQLKTQPERAALRTLKLSWGGKSAQKEFGARVLEHLARIEKSRSRKDTRDPVRATAAALMKKLRRRAKRVRRLADDLGKPLGGPLLPPFPSREMQLYADKLDGHAVWLSRGGPYAPPSGAALRRKRPPHRTTTVETRNVLKLVEFVQKRTGQKHWSELTILVRRATGDLGYSNHRLQALCHSHWKKKKAARPAPGRFLI
jgi:hypothetical protein